MGIARASRSVPQLTEPEHQAALASVARLAESRCIAAVIDLDGTLVPSTTSAREVKLDRGSTELLRDLDRAGVQVVVVSRRPRAAVERLPELAPHTWWMAEHGCWRSVGGPWRGPSRSAAELDSLTAALSNIAARSAGAWIEPRSLSVCFYWRDVAARERDGLVSQVEAIADEWLEAEPDFERIPGRLALEVRRRGVHTGLAVEWVRGELPDVRILALGDDVTDEDMFAALVPGDVAVLASLSRARPSRASVCVDGPAASRHLLRWLVETRSSGRRIPLPHGLLERRRGLARAPSSPARLLVISNRTPAPAGGDRSREVGGLVSALEPALRERDGIWLGWSGREREGEPGLVVDEDNVPGRASFDYPPLWRRRFYSGFCNRALWPLVHGLVDRAHYDDADWEAYVAANAAYARFARDLVAADAAVWVHDYHLLLVARALREAGHVGPIGLFLHVPFPARVELETLPWADEIVGAMGSFDLIGFHCARWLENFQAAAGALAGRRPRVEVFPLGVDRAAFARAARLRDAPLASDIAGLQADCGDRRLLLGVDRLDYSKGIPERLQAFERLLERFPEWRRKVFFVQVSVPSRADVPEYGELRRTVENLVGRINGRFGEADWVPVRYLFRSYSQPILAELYRAAAVAVVSPLRDGMNLVAKEFVAAQEPDDPGVLVLSRFAGAACVLADAVLTNPFHIDGLAAALDRALRMPVDERRARHRRLLEQMEGTSPSLWASSFLARLDEVGRTRAAVTPGDAGSPSSPAPCDDPGGARRQVQ